MLSASRCTTFVKKLGIHRNRLKLIEFGYGSCGGGAGGG